jgi:glycerate 2-kinase
MDMSGRKETSSWTSAILSDFLRAIRGEEIIRDCVNLSAGKLCCREGSFELDTLSHLHILAIGKAAQSMARGSLEILSEKFDGSISGLIVTKDGHGAPLPPFKVIESSHPLPSLRSVQAARSVRENLEALPRMGCGVLVLLSGGGSALLCEPVEGMSFEDKQILHEQLLSCGASITEMNQVRIALSNIKGGGLLSSLQGRPAFALVLSDVVGNDLSLVSSGPFFPRSPSEPLGTLLQRYHLSLPPGLESCQQSANAKGGAETEVPHLLLADYQHALEILCKEFETQGARVGRYKGALVDELDKSVRLMLESFKSWKEDSTGQPLVFLAGGESTLRIHSCGKGGRNMHFACELASSLLDSGFERFEVFSLGTDGTDGPTDSAGGLLSSRNLKDSKTRSNLREAIEKQDTYPFLDSIGALLKTGPTGTNLNDVHGIVLNPR